MGDGSDAAVVLHIATDPIALQPPGDIGYLASALNMPNSVINVTSTQGTIASTSYNSVLGQLTVTFESPIAADQSFDINGTFLYGG